MEKILFGELLLNEQSIFQLLPAPGSTSRPVSCEITLKENWQKAKTKCPLGGMLCVDCVMAHSAVSAEGAGFFGEKARLKFHY
jgi:hypothetical protein